MRKIIASIMVPLMMLSNTSFSNKELKISSKKEDLIEVLDTTHQDIDVNTNINWLSIDELRKALLVEINIVRKENNVDTLTLDSWCNKVAYSYSKYLFDNKMDEIINAEDHYDKKGNTVYDRVKKAWRIKDDKTVVIWENIISTNKYTTVGRVVRRQEKSKYHLQNLINKKYKKVWVWHAKWSNNIVIVFINE